MINRSDASCMWKSKYELKNDLVCLCKSRNTLWWRIFIIVARLFFALLFPLGLTVLWLIQFFNPDHPLFIYWLFGLFGVTFMVGSIVGLFYLEAQYFFDPSKRELYEASIFLGCWETRRNKPYSIDFFAYVYVDISRQHLTIFLKKSDGESVPLYFVNNWKEATSEANKVAQILGLQFKAQLIGISHQ
jgi:hypothetical protein